MAKSYLLTAFRISFVFLAAYVAPKHQLEISVIFLVILAVLIGFIYSNSLTYLNWNGTDKAYNLFHDLLALGAGIAAVVTVRGMEDEAPDHDSHHSQHTHTDYE